MVTQYETGGPKNQLPYVYGPEDDVYPMAWAGEIVLIADKGYSWDNRPTYSCHDVMNFDMKILYEDQLLFLVPNSADTTLPYNESLSGTTSGLESSRQEEPAAARRCLLRPGHALRQPLHRRQARQPRDGDPQIRRVRPA
jgi:hypothetical protein